MNSFENTFIISSSVLNTINIIMKYSNGVDTTILHTLYLKLLRLLGMYRSSGRAPIVKSMHDFCPNRIHCIKILFFFTCWYTNGKYAGQTNGSQSVSKIVKKSLMRTFTQCSHQSPNPFGKVQVRCTPFGGILWNIFIVLEWVPDFCQFRHLVVRPHPAPGT